MRRPFARPRPRRAIPLVVIVLLVAACATPPATPIPSSAAVIASPATTASSGPSSSPSPSAEYADTLRIANPYGHTIEMSNLGFGPPLAPASLVLSGLYRLSSTLDGVPDLTDGPCRPQGDGTVIRCRLIVTTFDDGSPLTADDVAYDYRLRQRDDCVNGLAACPFAGDSGTTYHDVRVVDAATLEFTLTRPDPTFLTTILPSVAIEPRHVIEAAFDRFLEDTKGLDVTTLTKTADAIDGELGRDPPACSKRVEPLKRFLARLHIHWSVEDFGGQDFDACGFTGYGGFVTRQVATALGASGLDAVAAAYPFLSFNWQPVGTGPYRFVSQSDDMTVLEASPTYHAGRAATRYLHLIPTGGDGAKVLAGGLDIDQNLDSPGIVNDHPEAGLLLTRTRQAGFVALHYNVRPGHMFADRDLRLALQSCVDLTRIVDAVTGDGSEAIESPFMPGGWAYLDLPVPGRDIPRATSLLEAAGWRRGTDGVYAKDGRRLAAQIVVRGDVYERAKAADLIAAQARDCGMDITSRPVRFGDDIGYMIQNYPHLIPGTKQPFDLYLGAWGEWPDPGKSTTTLFDSRLITTAAQPHGGDVNMIGFADPTVDRLIDAGRATYDQVERASAYRSLQEELAAQQPMLFLWSPRQAGAIRSAVSTTGVPLELTAPNCFWQPEKLVVRREGS